MSNPYQKYLTKEHKLQHAVITYLKFNYPGKLFTLIKYLGVSPGVPDLMIFDPNNKYNGLAIEFKIKYNKPTENQDRWLKELKSRKWASYVIYSYEDGVELIDKYFKNVL